MPTFKMIPRSNIQSSTSNLNQLVDMIETDLSSSSTRKSYQHFVTGGQGPGITSSLFQTVYDQDFTLASANQMMDLTMGVREGSATISSASSGQDASGRYLFPSNIVMGREKIYMYKQMAQVLLGNQNYVFDAPFSGLTTTAGTDTIDHAFFICVKRLFARDGIKPQSIAMRMHRSASHDPAKDYSTDVLFPNNNVTSESGSIIFTDFGVSQTLNSAPASRVGSLAFSSDSNSIVGSVFYDQGVIVLDMDKVMSGSEKMSGSINSVVQAGGTTMMGSDDTATWTETNPLAKFAPDFVMSASMDEVISHIASCRFSSGSALSGISFQNKTNINSTLVFCRIDPGEFNYSSNNTYTDANGDIVVVSDIENDKPFSYITTIGLYDSKDTLLAVAKTSRPIENNFESDLSFRIRLDF